MLLPPPRCGGVWCVPVVLPVAHPVPVLLPPRIDDGCCVPVVLPAAHTVPPRLELAGWLEPVCC